MVITDVNIEKIKANIEISGKGVQRQGSVEGLRGGRRRQTRISYLLQNLNIHTNHRGMQHN